MNLKFKAFDKFSIERPRVKGRSHLKDENPDSCKKKETKATCDESMAYIDIPVLFASILTYLTKSFKESIIFFNQVIENVYQSNKNFRIVALTATPGSDIKVKISAIKIFI